MKNHMQFFKVDGCTGKYDGTVYLALFHSDKKYERTFEGTFDLIMLKSNISDVYSHKYLRIKPEKCLYN